MLVVVDDQLPHGVGALLGDFVVAAGGAGVADGRADPGQQLGGAEGLGQIVVGPLVQCRYLVPLVRAGGDHHHRQAGPAPQLPEDVQPVHVGQAQIQNHQIRAVGGDHGKPLRPGAGLDGLIALAVQHGGDELGDALLVLDDQYLFPYIHVDTSCRA